MKKFIITAIPIVAMVLFIGVMLSSKLLKKPFGSHDDVVAHIDDLIQIIDSENWEEAKIGIDKLDRAWNKVLKRVQFSAERDEIDFINTNLARLRGAIQAEDKVNALIELHAAYNHWDNIGS